MKNKKITLLTFIIFTFLFTSCGQRIYEVSMQKELFEKAREQGVFKEKITLKKYPLEQAYEIYNYKNKVRVQIVSSEVLNLKKKPYKKAIPAGKITKLTKTSPVNPFYKDTYGLELERRPLFPCIPFNENCAKSIKIEEIDQKSLFTAENMPNNYIALPVSLSENVKLYAGDKDYPLYQADFADFSYTELLNKEKKDKWDLFCLEYLTKNLIKEFKFECKDEAKTTLVAAVGDMMLGRGVQDSMFATKKAETVFTDTMPILVNSHYTIGNLECVVTTRELKTKKTYNFKVSKNSLTYLKKAGFDYLMMTNNHSYDYGEEGFKDTLKAVAEEGFATSGAGYTKEEAMKFYRTLINGQAYSILSVGAYPIENSGFNGEKQATATDTRAGVIWRSPEVIELVKEEKKTGSVIIINVHAGSEYVTKPNTVQQTFYKELCDAGADVIFGSHPHVLQPVEMYNNSLIVWSLGNYIFPGMDGMYGATDTMIIRAGFYKNKLVYYEKYPARIDNTKVRLK